MLHLPSTPQCQERAPIARTAPQWRSRGPSTIDTSREDSDASNRTARTIPLPPRPRRTRFTPRTTPPPRTPPR